MKQYRTILYLLGLLLSGTFLYAEVKPEYYFKQISVGEGLSKSMVRCVLTDHKGLMWIGTRFGLNTFDGERVQSYYHHKGDNRSLPFNDIRFLHEDSLLNLWIGTEQELSLYDRENDRFVPVFSKGKKLDIYSFLPVTGGVLLFGRGEVFKYQYADKHVIPLTVHSNEKMTSPFDRACIWDEAAGVVLLSCRWNGLWRYTLGSGLLERVPFVKDRQIGTVCMDSSGCMWVSPYGEGLMGYDRSGRMLCHLTVSGGELTNDVILDIRERGDKLWLATDGGGINLYDKKNHSMQVIKHVPGNTNSLPVNSYWCLYSDPENNIWAGSVRGGLIGIKEVYMRTYKDAPLNTSYGLSEKAVVGMFEDKAGFIWLGTDGGGINRLDPHTGLFNHYPSTYSTKVISIIDYTETELLLSLFGQGLYLFNKQSGAIREFHVAGAEKENNIFCAGKSANLYRFNKDKFYILSDSIYLYNQSTKSLTAATVQGNDIIFPSLYMVENTGNTSYLHGASELFEVNHVQNTIRTVFSSSDSVGIISAACRNNKGAFWLGSANGLFYYSPANGTAVAIENDRFIGTTSLGFDQSGRLWVGTHNALYVYIPETGKIIACSESDGVSGNEYIDTPPLLTRSGDLYMAGVMGLVFIKNNVSFPENMNPVISLLDVDLNGASVNALVDRKDNFLSVPWNYTSLSAKVIVKGSDLMQKELFRYYIHGDVEKVIEVPSRSIALHSLSTGNYQIWVSYNKKNGDWSKPVMLLSLVVTPPWWKSGWFICSILLFLFISVTFLLWLFIKHKENKMFRAMKEHEQKTYEEKIRFLINISHELRTPLTLVYAPLKRILNSGLVENGELLTQLSDIFKQTRRIRDLINMTLNIRKMEVGEESLNMQNVDLNIWIRTIVGDFSHELAAHNIRLAYDLDLSAGSIVFDSQKCETVLSNLLMNALKFSDPDSCITITSRRGEDNMRIEVSDEGIGLGNTDATRLFTRFYQGEHGRKGSGIGLSYAKLLVELHGGKIGAFNNAEKGATFFFELPIDNQTRTIEAHPYLNDLLVTTEKEEEHVVSADFVVGRYSVLIVEDEAELCQYLKNALKESFKQVYAAGNGAEGLEQALLYHPDIIVSDVMMPVMDGFELCRQIKSNLEVSHIPIILLTARTDSASTLLGYKQGADLYVPKPFDLSFLQTVISNLLHNREVVKLRYKENTLVVSPQMDTISNADEQFMQKLNILIIDQLESPELDVNFVAEQMAMSRASLYNKLKSLTDISIGDYINKFRMVKAIELLSNTELSIMEVSEKVGFTNQRYFSTVFKQAYGTTPSQYRKEKLVTAD